MANDQKQNIELGITRLEWGDSQRPQRAVLEISTSKHYYGLGSEAKVYWHGQHSRSNMMSIGSGGGGDFSKTVARADRTVKATQKNIDKLHATAFTPEVIAELVEAAKAHYAEAVQSGIDSFKNVYVQAVSH